MSSMQTKPQALILRGSKMLTDATLQALARTSSALTLLDASHSPHFSDRGVHSLLSAVSLVGFLFSRVLILR